jgi:hypothetical protein
MACGNNPSGEERLVEKATAPPPVYKMDRLEKMFNNDNWMQTDGNDTSYYYFSRIPSEIQVHQYRMIKGDSVITYMSAMRFSYDSLVWQYNDSTRLFLSAITEKAAEWALTNTAPPGSFYTAFELKDTKHITVSFANKTQFTLTKTLPLSTFLVRSRYDYINGTHFAFTDTIFSAGKKK